LTIVRGVVMPSPLFKDRTDAGQFLARKLESFKDRPDVLVLALPRGGVPVAFEVAVALHARLDVFVVRKLGAPNHEELAFGAIASGGVTVLNQEIIEAVGISENQINATVAREQIELARRERAYRDDIPSPSHKGAHVILIDDGIATGSTMLAAVRALRKENVAEIIVAVPVAAAAVCNQLLLEVDSIVCAATPEPFQAVGIWYEDFSQTTDEEVRQLIKRTARQRVSSGA
jgi:putative phosphoribosyl transferase